jgi:hypothetical protein
LGRGEDNPPGIKDPQIMMGGKTASYIGKFWIFFKSTVMKVKPEERVEYPGET